MGMDALSASVTKFEHWRPFPPLQLMRQPLSSCKRVAPDGEQTLQQELKRRRIIVSPNKPFSSVSDTGRVELIFEVKVGRHDSGSPLFQPVSDPGDEWQLVPFYFQP